MLQRFLCVSLLFVSFFLSPLYSKDLFMGKVSLEGAAVF